MRLTLEYDLTASAAHTCVHAPECTAITVLEQQQQQQQQNILNTLNVIALQEALSH